MKKKKKNKKMRLGEKVSVILKSYKTIIYISFIINVILLLFSYYCISSNKIYTFSGKDDYLNVKDGFLAFNTDINILNANNIKYINNFDYEIKSYKIGYYAMSGKKLVEIISTNIDLDTSLKISDVINNFTAFNVVEKNNHPVYLTKKNKKLIKNGLYLVMEAKTNDGETVFSKIKLNVSKISKY